MADQTVRSPVVSEGRLQARLWIGHNPIMFVTMCALIGLWLGRIGRRRQRG